MSRSNRRNSLLCAAIIGCVVLRADAVAEEVDYTYDDAGRLISASYNNGETVITYSYDPAGNMLSKVVSSDPDTDGDGLPDSVDTDDDGDGIPDDYEIANGLDPLDAGDASEDDDLDTVSNLDEYLAGTDPQDSDTDDDTVLDAIDNCPVDANTNQSDVDGDGVGDVCDPLFAVVPLPDVTGDTIEDVAVMREGSILAEVRSGSNGAMQRTITFFNSGFSAVAATALPDSDGNGVHELAVLAVRNSDGRIAVEMRNITGDEVPRTVWFAANHTPVGITVIDDDADGNGVVELAVLSRRDSDGRGLVEVKNAFGPTNPKALWAGAGLTSSDVEVIGDKDANDS
jgi:YD repeat-containing protein